jgi:hypothetical protein
MSGCNILNTTFLHILVLNPLCERVEYSVPLAFVLHVTHYRFGGITGHWLHTIYEFRFKVLEGLR